MGILILGIGMLTLGCGVRSICTFFRCNKEIKGTCIRYKEYFAQKGQTRYGLVFQYEFAGKNYEQQSIQSFSYGKVAKLFNAGTEHCIFVNEKKPREFIVERRVRAIDVLMLAIGVGFVLLAIIGFLL